MLDAEAAFEPPPPSRPEPPPAEEPPAEPPAKLPGIGTRRAVFGLAEGEVVITAPVFLSPESVNDLQDYLDVFMKRARREAGLPD